MSFKNLFLLFCLIFNLLSIQNLFAVDTKDKLNVKLQSRSCEELTQDECIESDDCDWTIIATPNGVFEICVEVGGDDGWNDGGGWPVDCLGLEYGDCEFFDYCEWITDSDNPNSNGFCVNSGDWNDDGGLENPAIQPLSSMVIVDCRAGQLTELELIARARACDILLAPLRSGREYGTTRGSGSYGDAVYFGKQLIIPTHADPEGEFESLALYYSDAGELAAVLRNVLVGPKYSGRFTVSTDGYTTEHIFDGLVRDLKLCEIA